jgi:ribonuclease BN (tRNA processing enzyme)
MMKLRVLGCSGGELPRHRTTCFLVDGAVAIDAGALTGTLPFEDLLKVSDIVLTHSHLDHVKDVPLLADLLVGRRSTPVRVHASIECARTLRQNVFNGLLWPDFTRIPNARRPVMVIEPFDPERPFQVGRYTIRPVPVRHPVESVGFIVGDGRSAFAISGDTGPTTRFWQTVNRSRNLRALLVEMSFPNALQELADASGHLTPNTLASELTKVKRNSYPVYLYHLKPAYTAALKRELAALKLHNVRVLSRGDELAF